MIFVEYRLRAARKIDDAQTPMAELDAVTLEDFAMIRASPRQSCQHPFE
jgi:hypothetical protein